MEVENSNKKNCFLTDEMNELFAGTNFAKNFLFRDRGPEDNGLKKCGISGLVLKPNNLVTKLVKCGHLFLTDEYLKYHMVSFVPNSIRNMTNVLCVGRLQINSPMTRWLWTNLWKRWSTRLMSNWWPDWSKKLGQPPKQHPKPTNRPKTSRSWRTWSRIIQKQSKLANLWILHRSVSRSNQQDQEREKLRKRTFSSSSGKNVRIDSSSGYAPIHPPVLFVLDGCSLL